MWRVLSERPWAAPAAPGHIYSKREEEEEEREREEKKERREIERTTGHNCIVMLI